MGFFGIFSAVLNSTPNQLASYIQETFNENVEDCMKDYHRNYDMLIFESVNNWTVIKWPRTYYTYTDNSQEISYKFKTIVSAVDVYDGDFWEHYLYRNGRLLDKFHSAPDFFDEIPRNRIKHIDPGNPQIIAKELNIAPESIQPYFNRDIGFSKPPQKAFPDDTYELFDGLVFIDFWEKLGILYPKHDESPKYAYRLNSKFMREQTLRRYHNFS